MKPTFVLYHTRLTSFCNRCRLVVRRAIVGFMRENSPKTGRARAVLRVYFRQALRHPWLSSALLLGTVGIQAAELTSPLYLRKFFNLLVTRNPDAAVVQNLVSILVTIAAVSAFSWFFRRTQVFSIMHLESRAMADLFSRAFDYLIGHSYHFFISQFTGTLTRRVSKFAHAFEVILDAVMLQFFPAFVFISGAVAVLFIRNHTLGIILGGWALGIIAFQLFVARLRQPLRLARAEEDSRVVGTLSDAISNQTTITLFSGSRHEEGRFREAVARWRAATMRSWNADEIIWSVQGLLVVGVNLGILYGAMKFWQRGLLTVGDFALIQVYLLGTFDRLIRVNQEIRRFYDAFADATEMIEILETPHEIKDRPGAKPLTVGACEIAFKNVDFYFHDTRAVLDNFNLVIRGGEKVALVGPSGAGKTTVTKLLLRFYDVAGGSIEIDGQNVAAVAQESLRNAISFVPQEPVLFHRSLMENIRYGRRDAADDEVIAAAQKAHCHEFISALPLGYDTFVGERGVKLSGGERQRVAIARAILKNAPILVLDEATSSLDSESEALIQDALQTLMWGKTVVVIAHRLSTVMKMDRIIVLEEGTIIAQGAHQNLLEQGGLYQKLWSIQAGGFLGGDDFELLPEEEAGFENAKEEPARDADVK